MKRWLVLLMGIGLVLMVAAITPSGRMRADLYNYSSFEGLGGTTQGYYQHKAFDVSDDGATVVGNNGDCCGYVWKPGTGLVLLPGFPPPYSGTGGGAVSADGSVVGGCASTLLGAEACRWTPSGTTWMPVVMGDLEGGEHFSAVWDMSFDGNVSVGFGHSDLGRVACRWTLVGGNWAPEALGDLPGGDYYSEAHGCSANGDVVVGRSEVGAGGYGWRAFRWTSGSGMKDLGVIGKRKWSEAWDCSADGSVVVGLTDDDAQRNQIAFRWTAGTGMISLGILPGGKISQALGVSADGTVVVGAASTRRDGVKAIVWDAVNGMRRVDEVLAAHGVSTAGWKLFKANSVAVPEAGVVVIVGEGTNPAGSWESWRAVIKN